MSDENIVPEKPESQALPETVEDKATRNTANPGFLTKWAGALLLATGLFALGAVVAFGSQGRMSDWGWGFAILAVASLIGWFIGRRGAPRAAGDKYSRQRTVLGLNAVLSVVLLLVLLVGVNYIAARRHKVFDLTKNRINSLSDQTTKALSELKTPVKMTYVWAPSEYSPQIDPGAQSVLEAYRNANDNVQVEFLNAAQDPLKFQSLGLNTFSGQPVLVIEKADASASGNAAPSSRQEVAVVDEQNLTSAILKLSDPKPRVLYLLTGHGEQTLSGTGNVPMSAARTSLEAQNYTLKTVVLTGAKAEIPADAEAILVLGPQTDLSAAAEKKLQAYLSGKGRMAIFLQMPRNPLPRWQSLVRSLSVEMGEGLVLELDPQRSGGNPQVIAGVVEDASRHPILRSVSGVVLFPGVVPLRVVAAPPPSPGAPPPAAPNATALFETSINSNSLSTAGGQVKQSGEGPFAVAAAVEKSTAPPDVMGAPPATATEGVRAVVVGNASFAADGAFNQYGNGSFFLGAVNWVVGNDALVTIPPKQPVTNTITMTDATRNFAALFSLVALPLGILLFGTAVWWKRR